MEIGKLLKAEPKSRGHDGTYPKCGPAVACGGGLGSSGLYQAGSERDDGTCTY